MSVENAIQQLKDAVAKEISGLEARAAAGPLEIPRGQDAAAALVRAMPTSAADLKTSSSGFMLRVGRVHSVVTELHVALTHSGHISVAYRATRYGKAQPDEHWELFDPTKADAAAGEPWARLLSKFCERTVALASSPLVV